MIINKDMRTIQCVICGDFHYYNLGKEIINYYCKNIEFEVVDGEFTLIKRTNFILTKAFCVFYYKGKDRKISADFLSNLDKSNLIESLTILHARLISLMEFL